MLHREASHAETFFKGLYSEPQVFHSLRLFLLVARPHQRFPNPRLSGLSNSMKLQFLISSRE